MKIPNDNSVNVARQRVALLHPDSHFRLSGFWGWFIYQDREISKEHK